MFSNKFIDLDNLDVSKHGAKLHIDEGHLFTSPVVVDVETDEKDNFVGMALTDDGKDIYYYTRLYHYPDLKFIGHNIKADVKWMRSWGLDIKPEQLYYDTMLASYVMDPTKERHGLKTLARELLNISYPDYKDIVGKGRNRTTLDKQPTDITANYCGLDVLSTFRLFRFFTEKLNEKQKDLLENLEMPIMRLLYKMELQGVSIDAPYLQKLFIEFEEEIRDLKDNLGEDINWNSPKQVGKKLGISSTGKKVLSELDNPIVKTLLEYRELTKLQSTYVESLLEQQKKGKIYTTFNQLIDTGRLSSHDPNLQNIPTRTERGDLLRRAFVASSDRVFVDADYSQIEYRLLAHFTQEPSLVKFYNEGGNDIHEETARILGVSRDLGKTLNFASIYGAGPKKIVQTVNTNSKEKITEEDAENFLKLYWDKLPRVRYWVEKIKEEARRNGTFQTLSGQHYKLKYIHDADRFKRFYSERQAVNGTIQGSAAYIIKLAMLALEKWKMVPLIQVHDELLFELNNDNLDDIVLDIKETMESVVKLSVPLVVSIGTGLNWKEAKDNGK